MNYFTALFSHVLQMCISTWHGVQAPHIHFKKPTKFVCISPTVSQSLQLLVKSMKDPYLFLFWVMLLSTTPVWSLTRRTSDWLEQLMPRYSNSLMTVLPCAIGMTCTASFCDLSISNQNHPKSLCSVKCDIDRLLCCVDSQWSYD